jgi:hypothetical protein
MNIIGRPNEKRTCTETAYCRINKTKLVQAGNGFIWKCPVCGAEYDPTFGMGAADRNRWEVDNFDPI